MSTLAKYWPTIRQVTYGLLAALLAIAAAAGWITDAQSEQWLQHAVTGLGAIGFIVAGLYVDRAPKVNGVPADGPPRIDIQVGAGGSGGNGGWPGGGSGGSFGAPVVPVPPVSPLEQVIAEARRQLGR